MPGKTNKYRSKYESKRSDSYGNTETGEEKIYGSLPPRKKTSKSSNPAHETLVKKCISVISRNFTSFPVIDSVPPEYQDLVVNQLPTDLDIAVTAKYIHKDLFWKRCVEENNWTDCEISEHGFSWKQVFFEKNLQNILESFSKEVSTIEKLTLQVKASADYIFSLKISQLLSHPDLSILFDNLPNFSKLSLTYGVKTLRLDYNRTLFGMKLSDAESLAMCLQSTGSLCHLSLPSNLLDDDLLEILMVGLKANNTITHLDLSHNKITDLGIQILSEIILDKDCILSTLNLCNNQIHAEGGRILGHTLKSNDSLTSINLRLNRLGDMGSGAVFQALKENTTLTDLNMSSNSLGYEAVLTLEELLKSESSNLKYMDLASNDITDDDIVIISKALKNNRKLVSFDLRMNMISPDSSHLEDIGKHIRRNEHDLWGDKKSK